MFEFMLNVFVDKKKKLVQQLNELTNRDIKELQKFCIYKNEKESYMLNYNDLCIPMLEKAIRDIKENDYILIPF